MGFLQYGDLVRWSRKVFHQTIGSKASVKKFWHIEEVQMRRFLRRILADPSSENLMSHVKVYVCYFPAHAVVVSSQYVHRLAGAIILEIAYGYNANTDGSDPLIHLADEALDQLSQSSQAGVWLVDSLPFREHQFA